MRQCTRSRDSVNWCYHCRYVCMKEIEIDYGRVTLSLMRSMTRHIDSKKFIYLFNFKRWSAFFGIKEDPVEECVFFVFIVL